MGHAIPAVQTAAVPLASARRAGLHVQATPLRCHPQPGVEYNRLGQARSQRPATLPASGFFAVAPVFIDSTALSFALAQQAARASSTPAPCSRPAPLWPAQVLNGFSVIRPSAPARRKPRQTDRVNARPAGLAPLGVQLPSSADHGRAPAATPVLPDWRAAQASKRRVRRHTDRPCARRVCAGCAHSPDSA